MITFVPAARLIPVGGGNAVAPEPGTHPPTTGGTFGGEPMPLPPKQVQPGPGSASSFA